jgi:indole-3-glycerol phosphate synthase
MTASVRVKDLLREVILSKQDEIKIARSKVSYFKKLAGEIPSPLDFPEALRSGGTLSIIAEIKKSSPSAGVITEIFEPEKIALAYEKGGANAISVLTERNYFSGDIDYIKRIKRLSSIPVLRKDFIVDVSQIYESRACGADSFLLIVSALDRETLKDFISTGRALGMEPLVEVHDKNEIETAIASDARIIGVNSRNLKDLSVDLDIPGRLAPLIPANIIKVAESGIKSGRDAKIMQENGYVALLVGETLMRAGIDNCGKTIRKLKLI